MADEKFLRADAIVSGAAPSSVGNANDDTFRETANFVRSPSEDFPRPFGRYELRALLGRGGMGSVYRAFDPQLNRLVALKIPKAMAEDFDDWRDRFQAESRAAAELQHPNICPVFEVGQINDQPYLTMPLIEGETLAVRLKRVGRLPLEEAVSLVSLVARAISDAHQRGIVHRDLKPANIMIDRRGQPIIMDFGLAYRTAFSSDARRTLSGMALGTPEYMPPEQASGEQEVIGPSSDVYSLGVILYELTTGQVPFQANSFGKLVAKIERDPPPLPSQHNPEIGRDLESILLKSLQKAPCDRFTSASAFANTLDAMQRGETIGRVARTVQSVAREPDTSISTQRTSHNGRLPLLVGVVAGFLVIAGVVYTAISAMDSGKTTAFHQPPPPLPTKETPGTPSTTPAPPAKSPGSPATLAHSAVDTEQRRTAPAPALVPTRKPIVAPSKAVVVDIPDWSILLDASKEEAESWIAARRKDGSTVEWFDSLQLKDRPVFNGIASLDDDQTVWFLFTEMSLTEINSPAIMNARFGDTTIKTQSVAPYLDQGVTKCVGLFHGDKPPLGFLGLVSIAELQRKMVNQIGRDYVGMIIRPMVVDEDHVKCAFYFGAAEVASQPAKTGEAWEKFQGDLETQRTNGVRPLFVTPYVIHGELRFAYGFSEARTDAVWEHHLGWTAAEFGDKAKEMAAKGFIPDSIAAYAWDGAVRYSTIWVKPPSSST